MALARLQIVVEPPRKIIGSQERNREAEQSRIADYTSFGTEVSKLSGASVSVVSMFLREVAPDSPILLATSADFGSTLAECEPNLRSVLTPRIVLLGADRTKIMAILEQYRLAAAIESYRFFQWSVQKQNDTGYGLYGVCSIAQLLEADQIGGGPFRSERYCVFGDSRYSSLPELLVRYLEVYLENL